MSIRALLISVRSALEVGRHFERANRKGHSRFEHGEPWSLHVELNPHPHDGHGYETDETGHGC